MPLLLLWMLFGQVCALAALRADVYGQWKLSLGFKNILIWNKILDDIQQKPELSLLNGTEFRFQHVFDNAQFHSMEAQEDTQIACTTKGILVENVTITFGPYNYCLYEPKIASAFNKPMFSPTCADSRAPVLDTFVRFKPSSNDLAMALATILFNFKLKNLVYIKPRWMSDELTILSSAIESTFKSSAIDYVTGGFDNGYPPGRIVPSNVGVLMVQTVMRTYLTTRVYVILSDELIAPTYLMIYLDQMGLLQTGEYVVLSVCTATASSFFCYNQTLNQNILFPFTFRTVPFSSECLDIALLGVNTYATAPLLQSMIGSLFASVQWHRHYIGIIRTPPIPGKLDDLQNAVTLYQYNHSLWHRDTLAVFPANKVFPSVFQITGDDILAYDTVIAYGKAIATAVARNISLTDGWGIANLVHNKSYTSVAGYEYKIDSNGIAVGNVTSLYINMQTNMLARTGYFTVDTNGHWSYYEPQPTAFKWINSVPLSEPICGFDGSLCTIIQNDTWKWATTGAIVAFVFAATVALFFARQWLYERNLQMSLWKINSEDLSVQDALLGSLNSLKSLGSEMFSVMGSRASVKMVQSHLALRNFEDNLMREVKKSSKKTKRRQKVTKTDDKEEKDKFARVTDFGAALHKNNLVGLKRIHKTTVELSRDVKIELKQMCDIKHDNLCGFIGAVVEPNRIFIVNDFCPRGSLKDMLENDVIQLDHMFISSIVFDIIKGLSFIHHSDMKRHGNLKSTNCLVDSRWVIKLSGFGLHQFKNGQQYKLSEEETAKKLLWTAPELLSNPHQIALGSQKGDIYSFGIILYEIFGRNGPIGTFDFTATEIVEKVRNSTMENPYRPDLTIIENLPPYASEAMKKCWEQNPVERPNLAEIKKILKPLSKGLKSNIFDNMLAMMEKYTNNLEDIVAERTKQLEEERRKSEKLLLMMLPKSVAEKLKSGQPVEAETFDSVSIYFSDIVGFTSMSSDSTPMQIVAFLNDLYTCFDSVVGNYDVYKVETIGDAYMVVSGLPVKNGNNHAGEIASMSLNLLREIKVFKVRHRPNETLKLRIGLHSGSVVSGVVGLKMPRYCLFGDTVNTASRMESNGEALKIHCSSDCKAILDSLGGYEVVERGLVAMKGKGELLTYWIIDEDRNFRKERIRAASLVYPSLKKEII